MSDYKITNIISKYKDKFENKNDIFSFLMELHRNLEFKSNLSYSKLYEDISLLYKDPKPAYQSDTFTPDPIQKENMQDFDIFIFGSNTEGIHGAGAAKAAVDLYGASYGQPKGLQGNSYAIVTKDLSKGECSVSLDYIEEQINELIDFCIDNKDKCFWMTKIGCGLGGFSIEEIAPIFSNKIIPENLILPKEFVFPHYYSKYFYSNKTNTFYKIDSEKNRILCISNKPNKIYTIDNINLEDVNLFSYIPYDVVLVDEDEFNISIEFILKKML